MNYLAETSDFTINLALDGVVSAPDDSSTGTRGLQQLLELLEALTAVGLSPYTRLYFEDNSLAFKTRIFPAVAGRAFLEIVLAVPAATVDSPGFCSLEDLSELRSRGVRIAANGYSYVQLASNRGGRSLDTPADGLYRDRQTDLPLPLSANEVLFQLVESFEVLRDLAPTEFVLPRGRYNESVIAINEQHGLYEFLGTSDFDLDRGQLLRPRLNVRRDLIAEDVLRVLSQRVGLER